MVVHANSRITPLVDVMWPYQEEFNSFMVGDWLGSGVYRQVYSAPWDPDNYVIKLEHAMQHRMFCNSIEWAIWDNLKDHEEASKWLAPCKSISRSGNILVQRRTTPISALPDKLPKFLEDTHIHNFGMLEGRIVCHDYAFNKLLGAGLPKKLKMVSPS